VVSLSDLQPHAYPNVSHFEKSWGPLLWAAAALDLWWKPTAEFQSKLDLAVKAVFNESTPTQPRRSCLAMHVRHGDVCNKAATPDYRNCYSLDVYLPIARRMAKLYGLKTLFVATDDPEVIPALVANVSAEPWDAVYFQDGLNRAAYTGKDLTSEHGFIEKRVGQKAADGSYLIKQPILEMMTDLEAGSQCEALIGSLDSHMSELMLLRMTAALGAVPPFYSLGGPFCSFTGDDGTGAKTRDGVKPDDGLAFPCRNLTYTGRQARNLPETDACFAATERAETRLHQKNEKRAPGDIFAFGAFA